MATMAGYDMSAEEQDHKSAEELEHKQQKTQQQPKQPAEQNQPQPEQQQQPAEEESELTAVEALSDEERAELKETFQLLDRDNDGYLTVKELGEAMRAMAQHPTEQEINDIAKRPEGQEDGPVLTDFDSFLTIMAKRMTVPEPDDQLLHAFRVFDKEGTGVMSAADLRQILTTLGEKLTDEEVEELIREADDDGDGQINYQEFTQLLISQ